MAPTHHDVEVALSALHSDAKAWTGAADDLDHVRASVQGAHLTAAQFSYFADKAGVTGAYQKLVDKLTTLLSQASANCDSIAAALKDTAADYDKNEQNNTGLLQSAGH